MYRAEIFPIKFRGSSRGRASNKKKTGMKFALSPNFKFCLSLYVICKTSTVLSSCSSESNIFLPSSVFLSLIFVLQDCSTRSGQNRQANCYLLKIILVIVQAFHFFCAVQEWTSSRVLEVDCFFLGAALQKVWILRELWFCPKNFQARLIFWALSKPGATAA